MTSNSDVWFVFILTASAKVKNNICDNVHQAIVVCHIEDLASIAGNSNKLMVEDRAIWSIQSSDTNSYDFSVDTVLDLASDLLCNGDWICCSQSVTGKAKLWRKALYKNEKHY